MTRTCFNGEGVKEKLKENGERSYQLLHITRTCFNGEGVKEKLKI
jgi:hypothetical protein